MPGIVGFNSQPQDKPISFARFIRPYEPNVVKAAWNIFGDSYRYRQKYNEFKQKKQLEKKNAGQIQLSFERDFPEVMP